MSVDIRERVAPARTQPRFRAFALRLHLYAGALYAIAHLPVRTWSPSSTRTFTSARSAATTATWLWVIGLGGLVLWVDRVRRRRAVLPRRTDRGRRMVRGWHGTVGIAILVGVLGLSATGLTWSYYAGGNVSALREAAGWLAPSVDTSLGRTPTAAAGPVDAAGFDQAAALVVGALVAIGVGLFLPLLGVSLLAFLAADVVLSRRPSRRSPAAR